MSPATGPATRPKIAVVIGAIGVRGVAAIPLFEFLDEAHIETDLLIGSSGGGLLAAMRGAGFSTLRMREIAQDLRGAKLYSRIDYRTLIGFGHPKIAKPGIGSALKRPQQMQRMLRRIFGDRRLEELQPATLLQTADCLAGEGVLLDAGPLAAAVYATNAMAPDFPPIQIDGHWLVDGAYISPVPILEAVKRHADIIIALFHEEAANSKPADVLEAYFNILAAYFRRLVRDQTMLSIELHHHEIILLPLTFDEYIGPWETKAVPQILDAGRKIVERKAEEILNVVHSFA